MSDGYTVPRTVYRLEFDDEQHAGMVVRVRAMSMADAMTAFELSWLSIKDGTVDQRQAKVDELHRLFVTHVVDWNLTEPDGTPIEPTLEGLRSLEPQFIGLLVGVWQRGRTAVPAPLERPSDGGAPSVPEVSIPMEPLSPSLAS